MTAAIADLPGFEGREPVDRFHWLRVVRRLRLGRRNTGLRTTMLTLATWARNDGSRVYPSIETLANATEQSRRTVLRHLALLRDVYRMLGRITRGGGRGRRGTTSLYHLTMPDNITDFPMLDPDHRPAAPPAMSWDSLRPTPRKPRRRAPKRRRGAHRRT